MLWLIGPPAAALFFAREDWVLFALTIPVLVWWAIATVAEPMVLGDRVLRPQSTWSLIQQSRGKVDTEDLEEGRYVGLEAWRAPTDREREVLDLLAAAEPGLPQIAEMVAVAEVRAECVCGCPSALLYATAPSIPREAGRDQLAISAVGPGGAEVVLRLHLGHTRELEVTTGRGHDGTPAELPPAASLRLRHDDRGAHEAPGAQVVERVRRAVERVRRDVRAHRDPRGELQELAAVRAGQVGDRAQHALAPQQLVRQRRDVAHVDAAAHDRPALADRAQRERHELAGGGEDERRVERLRRRLVRPPAHAAPSDARERLAPRRRPGG